MKDSRIEKLIKLMLDYSVELKKGDIVCLNGIGTQSLPYIDEAYRQSLRKGAKYIEMAFRWDNLSRYFALYAREEQIKYFPQYRMDFVKTVDVYLVFGAEENTRAFSNIDQTKILARRKVLKPILEEELRKRWVYTNVPTNALAQDAKMSLEEFEDFYFRACLVDYKKMSQSQDVLKKLLEETRTVRIKGQDLDLRFSIEGIPVVKCDGRYNIPDGEVFTAPVKNSVNGHIRFNTPTIYMGKEFKDIYLEFSDGKIVKAEAGAMTDDLNKILDTDGGARYIGEFAFGLNKGITQPMLNILFDEKIFGSFHFTPGHCYEDADNGNKSAIHWDMVRILRKDYGGGEIYLDGVLVQKDGLFVLSELESLN